MWMWEFQHQSMRLVYMPKIEKHGKHGMNNSA